MPACREPHLHYSVSSINIKFPMQYLPHLPYAYSLTTMF